MPCEHPHRNNDDDGPYSMSYVDSPLENQKSSHRPTKRTLSGEDGRAPCPNVHTCGTNTNHQWEGAKYGPSNVVHNCHCDGCDCLLPFWMMMMIHDDCSRQVESQQEFSTR